MADSKWANNSEPVNKLAQVTENDTVEAREIFVKALNQHQGSVAKVVEEYYDAKDFDEFAAKYTYDAKAWETDREGGLLSELVVQGPDEPGLTWNHANGTAFTAPSRPPSRNESPSVKMAWTVDNDLGVSAPTNQTTEEEDLQRAIQMSMGAVTPEEFATAVATPEHSHHHPPNFVPTTRDDHKEDEWGLALRGGPKHSDQSKDSVPSRRKRESEWPVFLRCRRDPALVMHSLGPLIMLLHEIPAARNFFLSTGAERAPATYGSNAGWWRGEFIRSNEHPEYETNLLDEMRRLMAFLDRSDRSYGTADALLHAGNMLDSRDDWTVKFFENLYNYTEPHEVPHLWTTVKLDTGDEPRTQLFAILDFTVQQDMPQKMRNVYSQWDQLFWFQPDSNNLPGPGDKPVTFAYIETPAEVMTMRITTAGFPIEVPEVLYIDRYLSEHAGLARVMRDQMSLARHDLDKWEAELQQITQVKTKKGIVADLRHVLQRLIGRHANAISQVRARALWRKHEEITDSAEYFPYLPDQLFHLVDEVPLTESQQAMVEDLEKEAQRLKLRLEKVQEAVSRINEKREECSANLVRINQTLTVPSDDAALNPTHRYKLRGVVTSPNVVYMCRRKEPEPSSKVAGEADLDEWCMVAWDGNENEVRHEPISLDKIKQTMFTEPDARGNTAPIFVYATDKGLSETPVNLSAALQTFVKHDNRLFKQEIIEHPEQPEQRGEKRLGLPSPKSPAKRHRSDSGDSMDSNRASLGDMSEGDLAQMMQDQMTDNFGGSSDSGVDTEMRDMQPISEDQMANEIAAHMPPTPSLSADGSASPPIRRSTEQLANMSLVDSDFDKPPEMAELQTPFIVRRPLSKQGPLLDQAPVSAMNWPVIDEATAISGGNNPEEFYHQPK